MKDKYAKLKKEFEKRFFEYLGEDKITESEGFYVKKKYISEPDLFWQFIQKSLEKQR